MQVIVQSKSVPVTTAMREYIQQQLQRLFKRSDRITSVTVFLESVKGKKNDDKAMKVKISIDIPKAPIFVEREGSDLYQVVVDASRRAARYLRKAKEKHLHSRRQVDVTPWSFSS